MSAEWEIQKSLFIAISALGLRVYDSPRQQPDGASTATYPHVAIGAVVLAKWDTKDANGFDFVARIHIRSRSGGMKETKEIQGQIYDRLHNGDLTVDGYRLVLLQFETSDVDPVSDGSFHGISEFHGMIEKA